MAYGQAVETGKRLPAFIKHGSRNSDAIDRVGPVEHNETYVILSCGLHGVAHCRDIGVKAGADILDIKDQCIDTTQHVFSRDAGAAVQTENLYAGAGIFGVFNQWNIKFAEKPVFGAEQCDEIYIGSIVEKLNVAGVRAVNTCLIGDQSDIMAGKCLEPVPLQHVDAGQDDGPGSFWTVYSSTGRCKANGGHYCQQGKFHDTDKHDGRLH